jgi:hypothetical protein
MGFKRFIVAFVVALLFVSVTVESMHIATAQTGTNVGGTIASDTVWALANSPYNFTGSVTVNSGVTLTIEPGVTVDLNGFTLQVNGTLNAIGLDTNQIHFSKGILYNFQFTGEIDVYNSSNDGRAAAQTIIKNCQSDARLDMITINTSPEIASNSGGGIRISVYGGSPVIVGNTLASIYITNGSPLISNNTIVDIVDSYMFATPTQNGIELTGKNNALIFDNAIKGFPKGITISSGTAIIARNFISNNNIGITIIGNASSVIENNTITENAIGLNSYDLNGSPSLTITGNNFELNDQYNIYLGQQGTYGTTAGNVDAAKNWWATTDTAVIGQTIFDHKNNNNLGTVTFNPILTSENSNAFPSVNWETIPPINTTSTTNNHSENSTPSANTPNLSTTPVGNEPTIPQSWLYGIIIALIAVIAALSFAFLSYMRRVTSQAQK